MDLGRCGNEAAFSFCIQLQSILFLVNDKHRSARANNSYDVDGISATDALMMDKAMRRTTSRNMDSPVAVPTKSLVARSQTGTPVMLFNSLIEQACSTKVNSIGVLVGPSASAIHVSF